MINFIEYEAKVIVSDKNTDEVQFIINVDKFGICFEYYGEVWLIAEKGGERCIVAQLNNDLSFHFILTDKSEFTLS